MPVLAQEQALVLALGLAPELARAQAQAPELALGLAPELVQAQAQARGQGLPSYAVGTASLWPASPSWRALVGA